MRQRRGVEAERKEGKMDRVGYRYLRRYTRFVSQYTK